MHKEEKICTFFSFKMLEVIAVYRTVLSLSLRRIPIIKAFHVAVTESLKKHIILLAAVPVSINNNSSFCYSVGFREPRKKAACQCSKVCNFM